MNLPLVLGAYSSEKIGSIKWGGGGLLVGDIKKLFFFNSETSKCRDYHTFLLYCSTYLQNIIT